MPQLAGRARAKDSGRWVHYIAFYGVSGDAAHVLYETVLRDAIGICDAAPSGTLAIAPTQDPIELVHAALQVYIATTALPPGRPPPAGWPRVGRHGRLLV